MVSGGRWGAGVEGRISKAFKAPFRRWVHRGRPFARRVEGHDGEVDALERRLLVREVASGLHRLADASIDRWRSVHTTRRISTSSGERREDRGRQRRDRALVPQGGGVVHTGQAHPVSLPPGGLAASPPASPCGPRWERARSRRPSSTMTRARRASIRARRARAGAGADTAATGIAPHAQACDGRRAPMPSARGTRHAVAPAGNLDGRTPQLPATVPPTSRHIGAPGRGQPRGRPIPRGRCRPGPPSGTECLTNGV